MFCTLKVPSERRKHVPIQHHQGIDTHCPAQKSSFRASYAPHHDDMILYKRNVTNKMLPKTSSKLSAHAAPLNVVACQVDIALPAFCTLVLDCGVVAPVGSASASLPLQRHVHVYDFA